MRIRNPLKRLEAHSRALHDVRTVIGDQRDSVAELERQVAELRKASHDHCLTCGAMTPRYGMTLCGTTDCAQKALA